MKKPECRIILSVQEFHALLRWRDNNKYLIRKGIYPVFEKGAVLIKSTNIDSACIAFEFKEDKLYCHSYGESSVKRINWLDVIFKIHPEAYAEVEKVTYHSMAEHLEESIDVTKKDMVQDVLTTVASSLAYMLYCKDELKELTMRVREPQRAKRVKGRYRPGSMKPVVVSQFTPVSGINEKKLTKKDIKRAMEAWPVRGHWRTYKDGRRVFVKSYVKGKKRDQVSRDYVLKI